MKIHPLLVMASCLLIGRASAEFGGMEVRLSSRDGLVFVDVSNLGDGDISFPERKFIESISLEFSDGHKTFHKRAGGYPAPDDGSVVDLKPMLTAGVVFRPEVLMIEYGLKPGCYAAVAIMQSPTSPQSSEARSTTETICFRGRTNR